MSEIAPPADPSLLDTLDAADKTIEVDDREDTQVTQLYNKMSRQLLKSSQRLDAACIKAEKFRRLARNRPGLVHKIRHRLSQIPPKGPKTGAK
jgi:hypothetical protein